MHRISSVIISSLDGLTLDPNTTNPETEKLSYILRKNFEMLTAAGFVFTQPILTADEKTLQEQIENLRQSLRSDSDEGGWSICNYLNALGYHIDILRKAFRSDDGSKNLIDIYLGEGPGGETGVTEAMSYIGDLITSFTDYRTTAYGALSEELPVPLPPTLPDPVKSVPSIPVLLLKMAVKMIIEYLLQSLWKRLTSPTTPNESLDLTELIDLLKTALIDSNDVSFLSPAQIKENGIFTLDFGEGVILKFYPNWNVVETTG